MIAKFALIAILTANGGVTSTTTPMQSMELCEIAAAKFRSIDGAWRTVETICVRTEN